MQVHMNSINSDSRIGWLILVWRRRWQHPLGKMEVQQSVTSDEGKKVASLWEQMNKGVPNKLHETFLNKSCSTVDKSSQTKSDNWMTYLGMETKKMEYSRHDEPQRGSSDMQNRTSDEARKLAAAAALSAVKDAAAAAAGRGKVEIREVRDFASQEIEVRKLVDADSKEAKPKFCTVFC